MATENQDGQRLDNFLLGYLKGVPKTRIYRMIRKGEVRVNRSRCKPEQKLLTGDQVRIPPISVAEKLAPAVPGKPVLDRIKAAIIYESQDLLVLNKPSGLAVHGGSGLSFGVIEALRALFPDIQGLELVHRLDRDTSGCLMVAKNRKMLRWLHEQLRGDGVQKIYHAMVFGRWAASRRIVEAPLRKNELKSGERVVRVNAEGKPSETHYRVLSTNKRYSLVEARPITGRTHQIRVHCTHAGCPILGDDKYVSEKYADDPYTARPPRLMLHAYELRVRMPGKTSLAISAPYDEPFENVVTAQFGSGAHGH
ncbi:ribosomal large subunit pseudouridine synthase C [Oleiphilus messinensis]|uniref:Pseudouridine synthase n=1 Tax=Oleiphilus messinensis TaxID=141451 RepID=A0A1Y0IA60_9GAMM|nr:ribosomal large subunit pseudouridine synthase C [Oleiphilus messinensis]